MDTSRAPFQGHYSQTVIVGGGIGAYSTITAALATITDASASKPYTVLIYPGTYLESADMSGKEYITLKGLNREACIINSNSVITHQHGAVHNLGTGCSVEGLTLIANPRNTDTHAGVWISTTAVSPVVRDCIITGDTDGIYYPNGASGLYVKDCIINSDYDGIACFILDTILTTRIEDCVIKCISANAQDTNPKRGIVFSAGGGVIRNCDIRVYHNGTAPVSAGDAASPYSYLNIAAVEAYLNNDAGDVPNISIISSKLYAENNDATATASFHVVYGGDDDQIAVDLAGIDLVGCTIEGSNAGSGTNTIVYQKAQAGSNITVKGCKVDLSNAVGIAEYKVPTTQYMLDVVALDTNGVVDAANLSAGTAVVVGFDMGHYRVPTVTIAASTTATVTLTGLNWLGETITDSVSYAAETGTKSFAKPMKRVVSAQRTAGTGCADVDLGWGDLIGLYKDIAVAGDVIGFSTNWAAPAAPAGSTVSATYMTINLATINANDDFLILYNASEE